MKPKSIHGNSLVLTNGKISRVVLEWSLLLLYVVVLPCPLFYIIQKNTFLLSVLLRGENK